mmetsp:Transcript_642/g.1104  ORF Transcript_642/g.1104 Transcript_642/m.1104 type:complete len:220 (+) Transcript_642:283-942(+)
MPTSMHGFPARFSTLLMLWLHRDLATSATCRECAIEKPALDERAHQVGIVPENLGDLVHLDNKSCIGSMSELALKDFLVQSFVEEILELPHQLFDGHAARPRPACLFERLRELWSSERHLVCSPRNVLRIHVQISSLNKPLCGHKLISGLILLARNEKEEICCQPSILLSQPVFDLVLHFLCPIQPNLSGMHIRYQRLAVLPGGPEKKLYVLLSSGGGC